jgi:predicted MPP superfamily phosphohydrolase
MSTLQDKTTFVSQTNRSKWRQIRLEMERGEVRETPYGRRNRHWKAFKALIELFGFSLRMLGLYERGIRNATDIRLNRLDLWFENLPQEFNGFRLLQLSDLHADFLPGTLRAALDLIADVEADICVLTGDFRRRVKGPFDDILPAMGMFMSQISTRQGTYAVLGNHDSADMVEPFEALGIKVLINETQTILRNGAGLHLTGTDDIHYYYTPAALEALAGAPEGFRIALIHSPEFVDAAANNGFQLYLTGHTHGGQVCLPGGWPIITHVGRYRRYAHGLWRHGDMRGYTSTGVGVSGLPVRFNTRGEVALITLHAGSQR